MKTTDIRERLVSLLVAAQPETPAATIVLKAQVLEAYIEERN